MNFWVPLAVFGGPCFINSLGVLLGKFLCRLLGQVLSYTRFVGSTLTRIPMFRPDAIAAALAAAAADAGTCFLRLSRLW